MFLFNEKTCLLVEPGCCFLSSECDGADSLEHYAVCSFQWQAFSQHLRIRSSPNSLKRFLALDADFTSEVDLQISQVYAVKRAVDCRRRGGLRFPGHFLGKLLREGHQVIASNSRKMALRYRRVRAQTSRS